MKKTILELILTVSMLIFTCVPVYADESNVTVTADAKTNAPKYTVTISNSVSLANTGVDTTDSTKNKWTGQYNVLVTMGTPAVESTKHVQVKPKSNTFTLKGTTNPGDTYTATATQANQKWCDTIASGYIPYGTSATGNINVLIPTTANDVFTGTLVIEYGVYNN